MYLWQASTADVKRFWLLGKIGCQVPEWGVINFRPVNGTSELDLRHFETPTLSGAELLPYEKL